ncbi:WD40 repeat domain 95 [Rhizophlyctis rosea]|uniref:WD40 repeat domain 95 n=1 Tax=Rhizophlyctis rosea TaxID=64517 RepID=A0AAD5X6A1_9FUNG|nr:WD40 repeat domain 95 [Rhizophlyctis rosea]
MAFDSGGRRLVTGGRDGTIRTWNFNNGQQLQELVKADDSEVTSIAYLDTRDSKFFVATGWNRKITLFPDSPTMFNVYPSSEWPTEGSGERPLHHDDVLSLACYPPHLLATSSYDGEIVVCNLQSGHVLHRLRSLELEEGGGRSVDKVIFLTDRNTSLDASLISSGADGMIRWWNAEQGYLCWEVDGSQGRGEGIYAMRANTSGTLLITGDAFGWITCWDISDTCVDEDNKGPESYVMPILDTWRAHRRCIVSVDLAEAVGCVVTAGTDGCVRLFTLKGEYIGTFGQMTLWNISNPSTWMHPFLPPDVEAALQEEEADHEAVERLKTVAKKMTNFARQRKTSKSLKSLAGGQNPQQPKPTRVPPLVRAPSKQAVTTTRIRTPAHATEKPATPVRRTPPPKTADLLRRDYNTWYTNSLFAKEEFHRHFPHHQKPSIPPIGDSFGDRMDHAGTVGQNLRIYNKLKPYELTDVSQLLQTSSVVGIGKGSK